MQSFFSHSILIQNHYANHFVYEKPLQKTKYFINTKVLGIMPMVMYVAFLYGKCFSQSDVWCGCVFVRVCMVKYSKELLVSAFTCWPRAVIFIVTNASSFLKYKSSKLILRTGSLTMASLSSHHVSPTVEVLQTSQEKDQFANTSKKKKTLSWWMGTWNVPEEERTGRGGWRGRS